MSIKFKERLLCLLLTLLLVMPSFCLVYAVEYGVTAETEKLVYNSSVFIC